MVHGRCRQRLLTEFFRKNQVAELKQLCRALQTASRVTVFRALREIGYLTSYSHARKYYTLKTTPRFDAQGLWFWRDVGFSKYGTLRDTIVAKVQDAPAGHTHEELQAMLQIRVQDTLRDLVHSGLVRREKVLDYVYISPKSSVAREQLVKRRGIAPVRPLDLSAVIEVLLIVIRRQMTNAPEIGQMLRARSIVATDQQVENVLTEHDLLKKTEKSRSRRSRS